MIGLNKYDAARVDAPVDSRTDLAAAIDTHADLIAELTEVVARLENALDRCLRPAPDCESVAPASATDNYVGRIEALSQRVAVLSNAVGSIHSRLQV